MIFEGAPDLSCMLQDFDPDYEFYVQDPMHFLHWRFLNFHQSFFLRFPVGKWLSDSILNDSVRCVSFPVVPSIRPSRALTNHLTILSLVKVCWCTGHRVRARPWWPVLARRQHKQPSWSWRGDLFLKLKIELKYFSLKEIDKSWKWNQQA